MPLDLQRPTQRLAVLREDPTPQHSPRPGPRRHVQQAPERHFRSGYPPPHPSCRVDAQVHHIRRDRRQRQRPPIRPRIIQQREAVPEQDQVLTHPIQPLPRVQPRTRLNQHRRIRRQPNQPPISRPAVRMQRQPRDPRGNQLDPTPERRNPERLVLPDPRGREHRMLTGVHPATQPRRIRPARLDPPGPDLLQEPRQPRPARRRLDLPAHRHHHCHRILLRTPTS